MNDSSHFFIILFRSSEESDCFETAEDTTGLKKLNDVIETDFSQSIDNIDRILQNIDEDQEVPFVTRRGRSRGSESSGDVTNTSISSEPSEGRPRILKTSIRSTPLSSARVMKDWAVSTDEHLDRRTNNVTNTGSWYPEANTSKAAKNLEPGLGTCRSTSCIPSAQKEPVSVESAIFASASAASKPSADDKLDSAGSETSSTTEDTFTEANEKKKRLKSALIKRARSVAVFSLKLKERRAKAETKDALKAKEKTKEKSSPKSEGNIVVGGELSCVPIEMLISLDDVNVKKQQTKTRNTSTSGSNASTPTNPFGRR